MSYRSGSASKLSTRSRFRSRTGLAQGLKIPYHFGKKRMKAIPSRSRVARSGSKDKRSNMNQRRVSRWEPA